MRPRELSFSPRVRAHDGAGGVAFPEPDCATFRGITPWLKVPHAAELRNLPVTSRAAHDLHVHLLAAVPNAYYPQVYGFGPERFLRHVLAIADDVALAPDRPGHGVARNWEALEAGRA